MFESQIPPVLVLASLFVPSLLSEGCQQPSLRRAAPPTPLAVWLCFFLRTGALRATLAGYLPSCQPASLPSDGRLAGWQDGRLAGWQDGRLAGWQDGRMAGRLHRRQLTSPCFAGPVPEGHSQEGKGASQGSRQLEIKKSAKMKYKKIKLK